MRKIAVLLLITTLAFGASGCGLSAPIIGAIAVSSVGAIYKGYTAYEAALPTPTATPTPMPTPTATPNSPAG